MRRTDRNPPCPQCAAKPEEAFPSPRLARGAEPVMSIKVPENKTKAIDLAMKIASEDNGGANFQTTSRPGEAVAIPVKDERGRAIEGQWGNQGGGAKIPLNFGPATAIASAWDRGIPPNQPGSRAYNISLIEGMATAKGPVADSKRSTVVRSGVGLRNEAMKPVYRQPK